MLIVAQRRGGCQSSDRVRAAPPSLATAADSYCGHVADRMERVLPLLEVEHEVIVIDLPGHGALPPTAVHRPDADPSRADARLAARPSTARTWPATRWALELVPVEDAVALVAALAETQGFRETVVPSHPAASRVAAMSISRSRLCSVSATTSSLREAGAATSCHHMSAGLSLPAWGTCRVGRAGTGRATDPRLGRRCARLTGWRMDPESGSSWT